MGDLTLRRDVRTGNTGKEVEQMKFTIDVDIDINEISQKVAEKAEKEACALVDARCQKRIDQILNGYRPLEAKLEKYAEERVQAYVNGLVDEMFNLRWSYWGIDRGKELIKEYLGDHLASKVENIIDAVQYTPDDFETRLIESTADRLVHSTKMSKGVVKRLAEQIVKIQEGSGASNGDQA